MKLDPLPELKQPAEQAQEFKEAIEALLNEELTIEALTLEVPQRYLDTFLSMRRYPIFNDRGRFDDLGMVYADRFHEPQPNFFKQLAIKAISLEERTEYQIDAGYVIARSTSSMYQKHTLSYRGIDYLRIKTTDPSKLKIQDLEPSRPTKRELVFHSTNWLYAAPSFPRPCEKRFANWDKYGTTLRPVHEQRFEFPRVVFNSFVAD